MSQCTIIFYTSSNGQKPVEAFFEKNLSVKTKTLRILSNIKEYGLSSAIPHIKKLADTPFWETCLPAGRYEFLVKIMPEFFMLLKTKTQ